jgi:hypothetical protein
MNRLAFSTQNGPNRPAADWDRREIRNSCFLGQWGRNAATFHAACDGLVTRIQLPETFRPPPRFRPRNEPTIPQLRQAQVTAPVPDAFGAGAEPARLHSGSAS